MPLLGVLAPRRCAGCGRPGDAVCGRCVAALVVLDGVGCERCGAPGPWPVRRCAECAGRRLAFASARAAVVYAGIVRRIVAGWKEGGRRDLAVPLADLVVRVIPRPASVCLAFVPGDAERGLKRGHVPAEALARALGDRWALDVQPLLRRVGRGGARQAELRRAERGANARRAFGAVGVSPPLVCLVDDVYTTGSTVSACATALRRAGARRIEVVTLARAVR